MTVCVTVYVAASVTVIDDVVALLFHSNDPAKPDAVKTEFPQLSVTLTVGADGMVNGADAALPAALAQPFTVCVTVYVDELLTVMDDVVA